MFVNSAEEFLHDPTFHDRGSQDSLLHSDESNSHPSAIQVMLDDVRLPQHSVEKVNYTHHLDGVGSTESQWETDMSPQITEVILPNTRFRLHGIR
jgi:hypothetical protein